ncbi:MAG: Lrp/AsnC family transcriptional regulator [Pseudomonadota bacterium]
MSANIDKKDLQILSILQRQARISNRDLAEQIHLSPSSCLGRVKKLEKAGILAGYHAQIEMKKVARVVTCLATVQVDWQSKDGLDEFLSYVAGCDEILECYTISGDFDFFLKIIAPDMDRYVEITDTLLNATEAVFKLSSHVIMTTHKSDIVFPLEKLI